MIAIIDTGGANLASVTNAFDRLGAAWELTKDREKIRNASHVILPGVGAAKDSMDRLVQDGLDSFIKTLTQPTLGICLGMQLLFESSHEGPTPCLGIIPEEIVKMEPQPSITVPHMGWNQVKFTEEQALFRGIPNKSYFYFVHSYQANKSEFVKAHTDHGGFVAAVVQRDNFYGVQFHPERSGSLGAQLLRNFISL